MTTSTDVLERLHALHPQKIDLNLDRVWLLLDKLGHPEHSLPPVVHIAGTNGKGSTLAMIAAMAEAASLRVHRYLSPHLIDFHERIILADRQIDEDTLRDLLEECEARQQKAPITFFEITSVAALLAMSRVPADLLLLEPGLGGRLDATNVVARPALTLLAPISYDHQEYLGNSLAEIAAEKVAIGRPNVPMLSAPQPDEAMAVIQDHCHTHATPLHVMGRDWHVSIKDKKILYQELSTPKAFPIPALSGNHQIVNAGLAIAAAKALARTGFPLNDRAIGRGLETVHWSGRMEKITTGALRKGLPEAITLWIDGGHNPAAAEVLADLLSGLKSPRLILGIQREKDFTGFVAALDPYLDQASSVTIPDNPQSLTAAELAETHPGITPAKSLDDAIARAVASGGKNLLICGSLTMVAAALKANRLS